MPWKLVVLGITQFQIVNSRGMLREVPPLGVIVIVDVVTPAAAVATRKLYKPQISGLTRYISSYPKNGRLSRAKRNSGCSNWGKGVRYRLPNKYYSRFKTTYPVGPFPVSNVATSIVTVAAKAATETVQLFTEVGAMIICKLGQ